MPTSKRERQRAGRDARREAMEAAKRRSKRIRQGIIGVVVAAVAIVIIVLLNNNSAPKAAAVSCPPAKGTSTRHTHFASAPPMCINVNHTYRADVTTDVGSFVITLDPHQAPKTVNNFVFLARNHYFNGIVFHRVIPGFVVQGGDPTGTGTGGPGYHFADELPKAGSYKLGSLAMANSGPNTNGSQFFIIVGPQGEALQPNYSLFGQVTSGMAVVQKIAADGSTSGTPKVVHKMTSVTIVESA